LNVVKLEVPDISVRPVLIAPRLRLEGFSEEKRKEIEWAYPTNVNPGFVPMGPYVMVQMRRVRRFSEAGIELPDEARRYERWQTCAGLVWALGPLAYRDRTTMKPWSEGVWCQPGDFVQAPKNGGYRWEVKVPGAHERETTIFATVRDSELWSLCIGDPLEQREYL